jgi:tRNA (Thr-GGU) A37 N-methylase
MKITPIGIIHSPYKSRKETLLQGSSMPEAVSEVVFFKEYYEGLKEVEEFSHLIVLVSQV